MKYSIPSPRWAVPLAALSLLLAACIPQSQPVYHHRADLPGSFVDITLIGVSQKTADHAISEVIDELKTMHDLWGSPQAAPLRRANQLLPSGKRFTVAPSLLPLIQIGKRFSALSDHLIDPAMGALNRLWGIGTPDGPCRPPPTRRQIEALLAQHIGMDDIEIHRIQICSRNPFAQLDFSLFRDGYAVDLAIQRLRELGVDNALLNLGGNLRAIGSRRGTPWRIALRNPTGGGALGSIGVSGDEAVFTSGDFVGNNHCNNAERRHIIDPRTGYPVTSTQSVTVIHPSATIANAAANAIYIAGPGHWRPIAKRFGVDQVLLIDSKGQTEMTDRMRERATIITTH